MKYQRKFNDALAHRTRVFVALADFQLYVKICIVSFPLNIFSIPTEVHNVFKLNRGRYTVRILAASATGKLSSRKLSRPSLCLPIPWRSADISGCCKSDRDRRLRNANFRGDFPEFLNPGLTRHCEDLRRPQWGSTKMCPRGIIIKPPNGTGYKRVNDLKVKTNFFPDPRQNKDPRSTVNFIYSPFNHFINIYENSVLRKGKLWGRYSRKLD